MSLVLAVTLTILSLFRSPTVLVMLRRPLVTDLVNNGLPARVGAALPDN
jgi:hypothetical protein